MKVSEFEHWINFSLESGKLPANALETIGGTKTIKNDFLVYWAQNDTYIIRDRIAEIKDPIASLLEIISYVSRNDKYLKLFPFISQTAQHHESVDLIQQAYYDKRKAISDICKNLEIPDQLHGVKSEQLLSTVYFWAGNHNTITDLSKADLIFMIKNFVFPEVYNENQLSLSNLSE